MRQRGEGMRHQENDPGSKLITDPEGKTTGPSRRAFLKNVAAASPVIGDQASLREVLQRAPTGLLFKSGRAAIVLASNGSNR